MCLQLYIKIGSFEAWQRGCVSVPVSSSPENGSVMDDIQHFCGTLNLDLETKNEAVEEATGTACICQEDLCNSAIRMVSSRLQIVMLFIIVTVSFVIM